MALQVSGALGEGAAGLSLQADYGRDRPFSASLDMSAALGAQSVGLVSNTTSDPRWHNFTGRTTVRFPPILSNTHRGAPVCRAPDNLT